MKKVLVSGNVGDIGKFTSPIKLFDYLASSKPIMASSLPVFKEILSNKKIVFFVNDLNIYKWKLEINRIFKIYKFEANHFKNNFNLSKNYTYKKRVQRMFDFLKKFMKKKIFYWSPCLNPVGTVISTKNSSVSLTKYSKEYEVFIINACGEWDKFKDEF